MLLAIIMFMTTNVMATRSGQDVNPNGLQSGEDYNLNITDKKAEFICPGQEHDAYGNALSCNSYKTERPSGIADFISHIWDTDNYRVKLLQLRF